jgi:hypothetical protein
LDGRQEHADQRADDCDDNEQFDKREAATTSAVEGHGFTSSCRLTTPIESHGETFPGFSVQNLGQTTYS